MTKPAIKKVVRLSWLREHAKQEFDEMRGNPDFDPTFFSEAELEHYIRVLIRSYEDDWLIIDDIEDERTI